MFIEGAAAELPKCAAIRVLQLDRLDSRGRGDCFGFGFARAFCSQMGHLCPVRVQKMLISDWVRLAI